MHKNIFRSQGEGLYESKRRSRARPGCRADLRVPLQIGKGWHLQKRVEQTTVADIYLGCLDLTLFQVFKPWRQNPDHVSTGKDIEISPCRILGRGKRSGGFGRISHLTMIMGDHRPESPECFRRDGDAKLGDISFKKGSDKVFAPLNAVGLGCGKKGFG